jgi:hypothetical protein
MFLFRGTESLVLQPASITIIWKSATGYQAAGWWSGEKMMVGLSSTMEVAMYKIVVLIFSMMLFAAVVCGCGGVGDRAPYGSI